MISYKAHFPINTPKEELIAFLMKDLPLSESRGQTTPQNRLKKLGALRLLAAADNWERARDHAAKHKTVNGIAPLYQNTEQWSRAKSDAEAAVGSALNRMA